MHHRSVCTVSPVIPETPNGQPKDSRPSATLSLAEAAELLGISRSHAYRLARQDALPVPVIRLGRSSRVVAAVLDRYLAREKP